MRAFKCVVHVAECLPFNHLSRSQKSTKALPCIVLYTSIVALYCVHYVHFDAHMSM